MQRDATKIGTKCPECKGAGKLLKLWPLTAIAMPHELGWQRFTCWRCNGTGRLPENDPYTQKPSVPMAVLVWFWLFAGSTFISICLLLWP